MLLIVHTSVAKRSDASIEEGGLGGERCGENSVDGGRGGGEVWRGMWMNGASLL